MIWFRNSIADSCSKRKRSRTELLASISKPTRSGRLVSRLKDSMLSAGLLSSITRKSFSVRSLTKRSRLSVTVKTTLTSLTRLRMRGMESSVPGPGAAVALASGLTAASDFATAGAEFDWLLPVLETLAPCAEGCGVADGAAPACVLLPLVCVLAGDGAAGGGGYFTAEGADGSCCCAGS